MTTLQLAILFRTLSPSHHDCKCLLSLACPHASDLLLYFVYLLSICYVVHLIFSPPPSPPRFSACDIEKLGISWGTRFAIIFCVECDIMVIICHLGLLIHLNSVLFISHWRVHVFNIDLTIWWISESRLQTPPSSIHGFGMATCTPTALIF